MGNSDRMREAGAPSTGVVSVLSRVCAPHRGYSWSHHPRSRAMRQGRKAKVFILRGSLALNALHLLARDVDRAGELVGLEHPAFHHLLNRCTSETQILGRFRYGDFLAVFVFHPKVTSPPGKDWSRDTPKGYPSSDCTLYALAALHALASEVKRVLLPLLARPGVDHELA